MARTLMKALHNGEENLARDIIQCGSYGGNDNQASRTIDAALFLCCSRGFLELAKLLLDKGASIASTDKNLSTPLHGAVDNGHLNVVRLLITHGANVDAQNYRGDTPLHLAAYRGYREIVQCLMDAGADSRLVNTNSFTAENEAVVNGHRDLSDYLRSEQSVRHPNLGLTNDQPFDAMIQLDFPSIADTSAPTSQEQETEQKHYKHYQQKKEQQNNLSFHDQKQKPEYATRSQSHDYSTSKISNLAFIPLDPPADSFPTFHPSGQCQSFSQRHSTGRSRSLLLHSTNMNISPQESPNVNTFPLLVGVPSVSSPVVCDSNVAYLTPTIRTNRPNSCSPQPHHAPYTNCYDNASRRPSVSSWQPSTSSRRPSTSSTSSSYSDFMIDSGSDAVSSVSSGSDASGNFCDSGREDTYFQDPKIINSSRDTQEEDIFLLSLGVRNPPAKKYTTQLSLTSEATGSPDFSDIYDSSLFSLTSMKSRSSSLSISHCPSSDSMDLICSEGIQMLPKPSLY